LNSPPLLLPFIPPPWISGTVWTGIILHLHTCVYIYTLFYV
jgi:hypothetical protein